ncbi:MAG: hypothetical protein RIT81_16575 [Deltaproteobacteria bacterium]
MAAVVSATIALAAPSSASAQVEGDEVIVTTAVLGTIAGITNAIAVTVYAVEGRALGSGWVVSTLFSTAICGALTTSFIVAAARNDGVGYSIGTLFYALLTVWPGYYVIRSSLSEAEPGEYFDAEVAPDDTEDPISSLTPAPRRLPTALAWGFEF